MHSFNLGTIATAILITASVERFAAECRLKTSTGEPLCWLTNHFMLVARPSGWLLVWSAEFRADQTAIEFGDQEEMGLGTQAEGSRLSPMAQLDDGKFVTAYS